MSELVLCGKILSAKQLFKKWREKFASLYKSADELRVNLVMCGRANSISIRYVWKRKFEFAEESLRIPIKITGAIESIDGRKRFKNRWHGGVALNAICYSTEHSTDLKLNRNGLITPHSVF